MRATIALGLLLGTLSCSAQDSGPTLTGSVSYIYATPAGAFYPGEIGVAGTEVGAIRVYISYGMPIQIRSSTKKGDISSFTLGDGVFMHYNEGGAVLTSDPPVWPVTDIEIEK